MTILGAGMVHPTVLRNGGFDPDEYQGYAFGMGPDRMTMLRHGIGDIRLFFSADLRFVTQFSAGPEMRVPLSWLRDYVDVDLSPRRLAEELTMRGMEVSAIEAAGADWTDVVVGRVLEVRRHPNADTLWLTRVDVGDAGGGSRSCAAPRTSRSAARAGGAGRRRAARRPPHRAHEDPGRGQQRDAVQRDRARPRDRCGRHPHPGHGDELALGTPLAEVVGETVLDVDVKPNRGDALSMVGLAREIAAFTGRPCACPATSPRPMTTRPATSASASRSPSSTRGSRRAGSTA